MAVEEEVEEVNGKKTDEEGKEGDKTIRMTFTTIILESFVS